MCSLNLYASTGEEIITGKRRKGNTVLETSKKIILVLGKGGCGDGGKV